MKNKIVKQFFITFALALLLLAQSARALDPIVASPWTTTKNPTNALIGLGTSFVTVALGGGHWAIISAIDGSVAITDATLAAMIAAGGTPTSAWTNNGVIRSFNSLGQFTFTNTSTHAWGMTGTNGHVNFIDQYGNNYKQTTNAVQFQIQVGGVTKTLLYSNNVLTIDGNTVLSGNVGAAGTYRSITTGADGRVTAGSNPTTFAGYGLSDTSDNLRATLTDKTGTGLSVFATGATINPARLTYIGTNGDQSGDGGWFVNYLSAIQNLQYQKSAYGDVNNDGGWKSLYFTGSGSFLTTLNATNVVGTLTNSTTGNAATATTATSFTGSLAGDVTGTQGATVVTATIPRLGGTNAWTGTGTNIFAGVVVATNVNNTLTGTHAGNGSALTALNASTLSSGTVPDARLSANVPLLNSTNGATYLTPAMFGAVGDGITDDSAAFNAALGTKATILVLDCGMKHYAVNNTIRITNDSVLMENFYITTTNTTLTVISNNGNFTTLRNFVLGGPGILITNGSIGIAGGPNPVTYSENFRLQDFYITNFWQGVYLSHNNNPSLENGRIFGCASNGMYAIFTDGIHVMSVNASYPCYASNQVVGAFPAGLPLWNTNCIQFEIHNSLFAQFDSCGGGFSKCFIFMADSEFLQLNTVGVEDCFGPTNIGAVICTNVFGGTFNGYYYNHFVANDLFSLELDNCFADKFQLNCPALGDKPVAILNGLNRPLPFSVSATTFYSKSSISDSGTLLGAYDPGTAVRADQPKLTGTLQSSAGANFAGSIHLGSETIGNTIFGMNGFSGSGGKLLGLLAYFESPGSADILDLGYPSDGGTGPTQISFWLAPSYNADPNNYWIMTPSSFSPAAIGQTIGASTRNVTMLASNIFVEGTFYGNGAGATNLNGSKITSGTLADARLSGNVPLLGSLNTFTNGLSFGVGWNLFTNALGQSYISNTIYSTVPFYLNTNGSAQLGTMMASNNVFYLLTNTTAFLKSDSSGNVTLNSKDTTTLTWTSAGTLNFNSGNGTAIGQTLQGGLLQCGGGVNGLYLSSVFGIQHFINLCSTNNSYPEFSDTNGIPTFNAPTVFRNTATMPTNSALFYTITNAPSVVLATSWTNLYAGRIHLIVVGTLNMAVAGTTTLTFTNLTTAEGFIVAGSTLSIAGTTYFKDSELLSPGDVIQYTAANTGTATTSLTGTTVKKQ